MTGYAVAFALLALADCTAVFMLTRSLRNMRKALGLAQKALVSAQSIVDASPKLQAENLMMREVLAKLGVTIMSEQDANILSVSVLIPAEGIEIPRA